LLVMAFFQMQQYSNAPSLASQLLQWRGEPNGQAYSYALSI